MKTICAIALFSVFALTVLGKTHFSENFNDAAWTDRWVESTFKGSDAGNWVHSAGKFFLDENDKGIKTGTDYRFYQISSVFDEFSNKDEDLVFQFSIKNEQRLDCGGGYIKLLPAGVDQQNYNGDSPYNIMFGPDICGSTKRVHVILSYKGENHLINHNIPCETDTFSHVYTLIIHPDQTYEVLIDNVEKRSGSLSEDWDFLAPKQIKDPNQSKPEDWVDEATIPDPDATKPEGWDDISQFIPDPEAEKPEDWDSELDGDWEAPLMPNPDYQGEWSAPMIPNPEYKGQWVHPLIDNPDYEFDSEIYSFKTAGVGIEIWQVKSGSIFDNILVTSDPAEARAAAEKIIALRDHEKQAQSAEDEAARLEREEEMARLEDELEEEEEDGHVHDEL
eukprot:CAMPEP_0117084930 /NCGR_PEP_ID=MMETSP0472-20121206/59758_1 /TAXON_ID=693140 ORGANISM="Tiarina fusus, Strain LIS" /NCGR_SAMPLE_ID=MMETSP0472 /ASSEMBLY_ACC=CAM_ASM_000603 /LENGTH=390 /DNA_ID=CAMNT_0004814087 /DNA_START=18 /DNA_END=1190 /DNA_ORIENTATION=+